MADRAQVAQTREGIHSLRDQLAAERRGVAVGKDRQGVNFRALEGRVSLAEAV
jgi:hypothetical protein